MSCINDCSSNPVWTCGKNLVVKVKNTCKNTCAKLTRIFQKNREQVVQNEQEREREKLLNKWTAFGLDSGLFERFEKEATFLITHSLIYPVVGLQNSTKAGSQEHAIHHDNQGLLIKKEGIWVHISKIQEELDWDPDEKLFFTKAKSSQKWIYAQNGLSPHDRFYRPEVAEQDPKYASQNAPLHPLTKLSTEEMKTLLEHSTRTFGIDHIPESQNPEAVIQFAYNPPQTNSLLLKNAKTQQISISAMLSQLP